MEKKIELTESSISAALKYLAGCSYHQVAAIISEIVIQMPNEEILEKKD